MVHDARRARPLDSKFGHYFKIIQPAVPTRETRNYETMVIRRRYRYSTVYTPTPQACVRAYHMVLYKVHFTPIGEHGSCCPIKFDLYDSTLF